MNGIVVRGHYFAWTGSEGQEDAEDWLDEYLGTRAERQTAGEAGRMNQRSRQQVAEALSVSASRSRQQGHLEVQNAHIMKLLLSRLLSRMCTGSGR